MKNDYRSRSSIRHTRVNANVSASLKWLHIIGTANAIYLHFVLNIGDMWSNIDYSVSLGIKIINNS